MELSFEFYAVLIAEAQRVRTAGDWARSECLLRRAILIADQLGSDPKNAKQLISTWYFERPFLQDAEIFANEETGKQNGYALYEVELDLALMRYSADTLDFNPTPPMTEKLYILATRTTPMDKLVAAIFADANRILATREPNDPNYIGIQQQRTKPIAASQVPTAPRVPVYLMATTLLADTFGYVPVAPAALIEAAQRALAN